MSTRRNFLKGCSLAIAAMSGSRIGYTMFDQGSPVFQQQKSATSNGEILIAVYLRGGMDGLSFMPPIDGEQRAYYEQLRPRLALRTSGENAALNLNDEFGLNPRANRLYELFQDNKLAMVHAVGNAGSRSHFDAMTYMELGTPFNKTTKTGWLTRTLQSGGELPPDVLLPVLAAGSTAPESLRGEHSTLNMTSASNFGLSTVNYRVRDELRSALRNFYSNGFSLVKDAGLQALNAADIIETYGGGGYTPLPGASYPNSSLGRNLQTIASMIKLDLGLRVATVDFGGWDTHDGQDNSSSTGYFGGRVQDLSDSLAAFYADLNGSGANNYASRTTIMVMSEFGRRVRENSDQGTDHGTGNVFMVLGGAVKGGVHGAFPGLHTDQLFENTDLNPTTDYRTILSEVVMRRLANPNIGTVFPGLDGYQPLDLMEGIDLTPVWGPGKPLAPVVGEVEAGMNGSLKVAWEAVEHAKGYRVESRTDPEGDWELMQIFGDGDNTEFTAEDLDPATYFEFRVIAFNDAGTSEYSNEVAGATLSALESWRYQHYGRIDNAGDAADEAETRLAGINNLLAFSLDLDPDDGHRREASGFSPGMPVSERQGEGMRYHFVKPPHREGISYDVMFSTDMKQWQSVPYESAMDASGYEQCTASRSGDARGFFRLKVERS